MPVLSRVLGWTPPDNEDYLDVALSSSPLLPLQNPTFHISEPNPVRRRPSPASTTSPLSSDAENDIDIDIDSHTDTAKRVDHNGKHLDPSWVARPRNEFILFRCDYVRKHSREGKRVRRPPGAEAEKTLSKQAAEAWHHLPPEERLFWKDRANGERNEHARRYPDYRYRPKKSAAGRRRQTRSSPTKQPQQQQQQQQPAPLIVDINVQETSPSVRRRTTDAAPVLRLKSTSPVLTRDASAADLVVRSTKMRPRRSCSVPELNGTIEPVNRRLRSTASHGWLATSGASSSHTYKTRLSSALASGDYSASPTPQPPNRLIHPTSSSLLNWNGERMVASIPQPTQFLSSTAVSFSGSGSIDMGGQGGPLLTEFTTGGNPIAPSQMFSSMGMSMGMGMGMGMDHLHPSALSLSLTMHAPPQPHTLSPNEHQHYTATAASDIWMPQLHSTSHAYPGDDIDIDIGIDIASRATSSGTDELDLTLPPSLSGAGSGSGSGSGSDGAANNHPANSNSPSPTTGGGGGGVAPPSCGGGGSGMFDSPLALSHMNTNVVDYGGPHPHSHSHSQSHSGMPGSSPETLFAMDTEELFANMNY